MRAYMIIGLALIAAGLFGLALEHAVFDGVKELIDAGAIKVTPRTDRFLPATTLISACALAGGLALLVLGPPRRSGGAAE